MSRRTLSRRDFGRLLGAAGALSLTPRLAWSEQARTVAPRKPTRGPSKLLIIHVPSGMDDLYSIDPKEAHEVKAGIGPVFTPSQLLAHGAMRVAPPWHCLEPYFPRMQVLTGIQVRTVSHIRGHLQVAFMKTQIASAREASFPRVVGELLAPDAPLHAACLGFFNAAPTGRVLLDSQDGAFLTDLHRTANDEQLHDLATQALRAAVGSDPGAGSIEKLLHALKGVPAPSPIPDLSKIDPAEWPLDFRARFWNYSAREFEWARLLLQHDIAPVVSITPLGAWDTHTNNSLQGPLNHQLAMYVKHMLDSMTAIKRGPGTLADEVGIVILSELGRFPYVNRGAGKDHFPQISVTLIGPGLVNDKFGETDSEKMGLELSRRTGRPGKGGALPTHDDLGRTLLEWVGHPHPGDYGYQGDVLEFCFS